MDDLIGQVAELALQANTAIPLAEATSMSSARDFFASPQFANHMKSQEYRVKASQAVMQRVDVVIKAIGMLGKALSRRGR